MESVKVMMSDPAIREFLAMLEGNAAGEAGFRSLMGHIGQIEGRLFEGARESAALRAEIAAMREDMRHPVRVALTEAADRLDRALAEAGKRLDEIKAAILDGAKKAVAAVREKGISALGGAMGFLGVKKKMAALRDHLDGCVRSVENSISKIERISAEYHETGKHLRNMGRALKGKEAIHDTKPMGKVAKTVRMPVKCARAAFSSASKSAAASVTRLEQLEKAARPSVRDTIRNSRQQTPAKPTGMALEKHKSQEASL